MLTLPSLLEAMTKEEGPSRNSIKKLNVSIVAIRDTRRPTAGQRRRKGRTRTKVKSKERQGRTQERNC
jgi:hypothetical protein